LSALFEPVAEENGLALLPLLIKLVLANIDFPSRSVDVEIVFVFTVLTDVSEFELRSVTGLVAAVVTVIDVGAVTFESRSPSLLNTIIIRKNMAAWPMAMTASDVGGSRADIDDTDNIVAICNIRRMA
jgi:hypothetical protein